MQFRGDFADFAFRAGRAKQSRVFLGHVVSLAIVFATLPVITLLMNGDTCWSMHVASSLLCIYFIPTYPYTNFRNITGFGLNTGFYYISLNCHLFISSISLSFALSGTGTHTHTHTHACMHHSSHNSRVRVQGQPLDSLYRMLAYVKPGFLNSDRSLKRPTAQLREAQSCSGHTGKTHTYSHTFFLL